LKAQCVNKRGFKTVSETVNKPYYDKAYKLLNTRRGKQKMRLRGSTVEPVWGTLLHYRRLKKVYTIGNELANKQVLMASAAYNLKKYMNFNTIKSAANAMKNIAADLKLAVLNELFLVSTNFLFVCFFFSDTIFKDRKSYVCYAL
jgi:hypothetical protein